MGWQDILKNTYPQSTREQLLNLNVLWRFSSMPDKQKALSMSDADFDAVLVKAMKRFIRVFMSLRQDEKAQRTAFFIMSNAAKENLKDAKEAIRLLKQLGLDGKLKQVANSMPKEDPRNKPPVAPPPAQQIDYTRGN